MAPPLRTSRAARAAAWLVCGPLGHLLAGLLDWAALLAGTARRRRSRS